MDRLEEALIKFRGANKKEDWFACIYNMYQESPARAIGYLHEFRSWVRSEIPLDPKNNMALLKKAYLLSAKESLDDFMIYVEWEREPEKRFWLPRRDILLPVCHDIQSLLNDDLDILTISLPPGTGKTTLKTFVLPWQMGNYPDKPNLDSGHANSMTKSTYDGVLSILTDPEYLWSDVFGSHKIITDAKELTIDIDKKHRFSSLTCRAIGGSLTGATRCEGLLTADDLVSGMEEAMSIDRLNKKYQAYTDDLKTRKKMGAKELHIATRWSVHDVIGRIQLEHADDPRAKFVVIPALNEDGESNFNYRGDVGFDTKYFLDMKGSLDDISFRSLFMNQPIEREGLLYHPDDLRRYYELPEGDPDAILAVCDTAEGGGDDTVMPVFAVYGKDHYMIDCVCSNALPEVTDSLAVECLIRNKVQKCQYESNSAGGRTADKVYEMVKAKGKFCHITKKRTTANKETKIIVSSPWIKEHCLFLDEKKIQKKSPYASFMLKMCSYVLTGKNKHDDVVDALAQYSLFYDSVTNYVTLLDRKSVGF